MNKKAANSTSSANAPEQAANFTNSVNAPEQNWESVMKTAEPFGKGNYPDKAQTATESVKQPSTDTVAGSNVAEGVSMNASPSDHGPESDRELHPESQSQRPETAMGEKPRHTEQDQNAREVEQARSDIAAFERKLKWLAERYIDFKVNGQIQEEEIAKVREAVETRTYKQHITEPLRQARDTILEQGNAAPEDPIIRRAGVLLDIANMRGRVEKYYGLLKYISKIESELDTLRGMWEPVKFVYGLFKRFNEEGLSNLLIEEYDEAARQCRAINEMAQKYLDELGDDDPSTSPQTPNANDSTSSVPSTTTSASEETLVTHGSTPSDGANSLSSAE